MNIGSFESIVSALATVFPTAQVYHAEEGRITIEITGCLEEANVYLSVEEEEGALTVYFRIGEDSVYWSEETPGSGYFECDWDMGDLFTLLKKASLEMEDLA